MAEIILGGNSTGSTALSPASLQLTMIFSGQYVGSTTLSDDSIEDLSGNSTGSTALSPTNAQLTLNLSGTMVGSTSLAYSEPLPMVGVTTLSAYLEVTSGPPQPFCICPTGKEFRWGHVFTRFDLPLYLKDLTCTLRESPFEVKYAMYHLVDESYVQAGPPCRIPVTQGVGEFYATGTAGEFGQPGDWQIVWSVRVSFNSPVLTKTYSFRVVDAISSPITGDPTPRHTKYGWD